MAQAECAITGWLTVNVTRIVAVAPVVVFVTVIVPIYGEATAVRLVRLYITSMFADVAPAAKAVSDAVLHCIQAALSEIVKLQATPPSLVIVKILEEAGRFAWVVYPLFQVGLNSVGYSTILGPFTLRLTVTFCGLFEALESVIVSIAV